MRLSDQARRRLYLLIFLIFGPMLLLGAGLLVHYRTGSGSTRAEERRLSSSLRITVHLDQVEYQRPGQKRWLGLSLWNEEEPILLAPEVLVSRQKTLTDPIAILLSGLEDRIGSEITLPAADDQENAGYRLEIPLLLLRRSQIGSLGSSLQNAIPSESPSPRALLWYARRILILEDDPFFRWFNEGLPVSIPDSLPMKEPPAEEITEANETKIIEQIQAFATPPPLIEDVCGCWLAGQEKSFFFASFNPVRWLSPSTGNPLWLQTSTVQGKKTILFDSPLPFPVSLIREFCPTLPAGNPESWMRGTVEIHSPIVASSQTEPHHSAKLRHFTLAQTSIESLLQPPLTLSGQMTRLNFDEGEILNGALMGQGSFVLSQVRIAPEILTRLREPLRLGIQPPDLLKQAKDPILFEQMRGEFELTHSGIRFSSPYPNGVIAAGNKDEKPRPMLFLSPEGGEVPYPELLNAVDQGERPFWSPFYRKAINRLPVE